MHGGGSPVLEPVEPSVVSVVVPVLPVAVPGSVVLAVPGSVVLAVPGSVVLEVVLVPVPVLVGSDVEVVVVGSVDEPPPLVDAPPLLDSPAVGNEVESLHADSVNSKEKASWGDRNGDIFMAAS
jgi:hypothetical protein